jgi:hypothetical protein
LGPILKYVLCDREAERKTADVLIENGFPIVLFKEGIEHSMHPQKDPAAPVLYNHLPQSFWEAANVPWPHRSLIVFVDAVMLAARQGSDLPE